MSDLIVIDPIIEESEVATFCCDFDEDCAGIDRKLECYLWRPENGRCPYLNLPEE